MVQNLKNLRPYLTIENILYFVVYLLIIFFLLHYIRADGFVKGIGYAAPHHLAVAANLSESFPQLCNSLKDGVCVDSYNHHPVLSFYINNLVFRISDSAQNYIDNARYLSVFLHLIGILFIAKTIKLLFGKDKTNLKLNETFLIVTLVFFSTISFWEYLLISNMESYSLLVFSMLFYHSISGKTKYLLIGGTIGLLTSWYLGLIVVVYWVFFLKKTYRLTLYFLLIGIISLSLVILPGFSDESLHAILRNIGNSTSNLGWEVIYKPHTMFGNIKWILTNHIPMLMFVSLLFFNKNYSKFSDKNLIRFFLVVITWFILWFSNFYMWSMIHHYIFLMVGYALVIFSSIQILESYVLAKNKTVIIFLLALIAFSLSSMMVYEGRYYSGVHPNEAYNWFKGAVGGL